jgi:hypothetical protein
MDAVDFLPGSHRVSTLEPYVTGLAALKNTVQKPSQSVQTLRPKQSPKSSKTSKKQMRSSDTSMITPEDVPELYQEPTLKKRFYVMNVVSKVSYFLLVCAVILILSVIGHTIYKDIVGEEDKSPTERTHIVEETSTSFSMNSTMKTCLCINGKQVIS